ncbi:MAG: hypothetical protein IPK85_19980 [Gemmatimonadetes bacterium]|nr:hypothetical protein [Gemmatimonadota bacterium]
MVAVALLTGCDADEPSAPKVFEPATVEMCEVTGAAPVLVLVPASEVAARRQRGDYVTKLLVDPSKPQQADSMHFRRLTDALDVARAGRVSRKELTSAACRITILVAVGTLRGSAAPSSDPAMERFPLRIDVPDVTVRGALQVQQDEDGLARTPAGGAPTTRIEPSPALAVVGAVGGQPGLSQPIFVVDGVADGSLGGHRAVIEGFTLTSGHAPGDSTVGGQGILSLRVRGLLVRSNEFQGNFTERIDLRASDGDVQRNVSSGTGNSCDFCLAGPGTYTATGNRLVGGGIPGIYVSPTVVLPVPGGVDQYLLPNEAEVNATISNNHVGDHLRRPVGTGLRLSAIGVGAPNVKGHVRASLTDNVLVNNTFGIIVEAGFPVAGSRLRGDITVEIGGNDISGSCQAPILVSFSRHTTGLGLTNQPYLQNSTYSLVMDGNAAWDQQAWYAHTRDRGNTLTVNGGVVAPGSRSAYEATGCPRFGTARIGEAMDDVVARH